MHRRMDETGRRQFKSEVKAECEPQNYKRSNRESLAFSLTSWIPRCAAVTLLTKDQEKSVRAALLCLAMWLIL